MKLGEVAFLEAIEEYKGYCSNCDDITLESGVEPDAEGYECPECGNNTVMGAADALLGGYLDIEERGVHPKEHLYY